MSSIIRTWTMNDEKRFESALLHFPEDSPDFLENIALQKPVDEVRWYYVCKPFDDDVTKIDTSNFALPIHPEDEDVNAEATHSTNKAEKRRKRNTWSDDEHRLFLCGLDNCEQGNWKTISRQYVKSRNPTQVASHAQKYFKRQKMESKEKKRHSIHDITLGDTHNLTVPGSNLESICQQQQCGVQTPMK